MAVTNTNAQAELARRLGPYVALVDLQDLVLRGARSLGIAQADAMAVTDLELGFVTVAQANQLLDVAESAGLDWILANLDPDELRRAGINEDPAKIAARLSSRVEYLHRYLREAYGIGLAQLSTGVLGMGDLQTCDTADEFGCDC